MGSNMHKHISLLALSIMIVMGLFVGLATPAQADGKTASPTAQTKVTTGYVTRQETVCDTGSYGQQNCHVVFTQVPVHQTVNTGVDPSILGFLAAMATVSALVIYATLKLNA
jgi:hypothetical protein